MAEPVFDEHPLQDYFRQTGESSEPMPGTAPDFAAEPDQPVHQQWFSKTEEPFSERFKYNVISSSLLSSAIATSTTSNQRECDKPDTTPSPISIFPPTSPLSAFQTPHNAVLEYIHRLIAATGLPLPLLLASVFIFLLASGFYLFAGLSLVGAIYAHFRGSYPPSRTDALLLTEQALVDLISSGNVWDSAVNEAITLIEKEERSIFYGPTSPSAPSSSLRVALQSSLHATQRHCDNVRHLLSALTDASQLTQLSEMYAPVSPLSPSLSLSDNPRPVSASCYRTNPSISMLNKRATWNGSPSLLARAGNVSSRTRHRRLQKSEVFPAIEEAADLAILSAPVSPSPAMTNYYPLQTTQEADDVNNADPNIPDLPKHEYFGSAAMDLRRRRRSSAMEIVGGARLPSCSTQACAQPESPSDPTATLRSPTRLSPVHTTRHPLSLSGLHLALYGALSAKRYACSYLLALRFEEEDDDAYWEDVRSVMALLTSTFADASSRLTEALDEAAKRRIKDETPSPILLPTMHLRSVSGSSSTVVSASQTLRKQRPHVPARTMAEMVSFAPMPSELVRFATHVDSIVCALNDARENLEQCVDALRSTNADGADGAGARDRVGAMETQEHPAFQAYDRLRKELGLALRECERGREKLLDIIAGPRDVPNDDADADADDTPALGQDTGSDESDKADPLSPADLQQGEADLAQGERLGLSGARTRRVNDHGDHEDDDDDATAHLLRSASSGHLPAPGAEQVFEAEPASEVPFARERSKLSREERIELVKARRARNANGARTSRSFALALDTEQEPEPASVVDRWGPGGEVVQELKDVIWKVGERRRKLTEAAATTTKRTLSAEESPASTSPLPLVDLLETGP